MVRAVEEHLGVSAERLPRDGAHLLTLNKGMSIRILPHPAGPLSQICRPGEESRLEEYVASLLSYRGEISCAVLEMPETLRDAIGDPYPFARRALARGGCLVQVLLVGEADEERSGDSESSNKWDSSVRDCFRMLGVAPEEALEGEEFSPAGFTIIQRDTFRIGEQKSPPFALPVACRLREGTLQCLMPGEKGWSPYAHAALKIFAGEYERWSRGRDTQNNARFEAFFSGVLEQLCSPDERVVVLLVEQESTAHRIKTLQNKELRFDSLEIGGRVFTPERLPNLCVVRISTDYSRAPFYSPTTEVQWPSGVFRWPDQERTLYTLKQKPASVGGRSKASLYSRHAADGKAGARQRLAGQLDEMSVIFKPRDLDPIGVAVYAHRLRGFHEQYDGDTQLPFPLHELLLLKKSVTF